MTKNWDEICDEEKSFNAWFKQNGAGFYREYLERIPQINTIVDLFKMVYMKGYAAGFDYKRRYSAEEQLQK